MRFIALFQKGSRLLQTTKGLCGIKMITWSERFIRKSNAERNTIINQNNQSQRLNKLLGLFLLETLGLPRGSYEHFQILPTGKVQGKPWRRSHLKSPWLPETELWHSGPESEDKLVLGNKLAYWLATMATNLLPLQGKVNKDGSSDRSIVQLKNGQKHNRRSQKKNYKWLLHTWKDTQLWEIHLKLHWDNIFHLWDWQNAKCDNTPWGVRTRVLLMRLQNGPTWMEDKLKILTIYIHVCVYMHIYTYIKKHWHLNVGTFTDHVRRDTLDTLLIAASGKGKEVAGRQRWQTLFSLYSLVPSEFFIKCMYCLLKKS